ncbi:MAG: HDOD domain-containing protein [Phycisphaerales bacterium]|nr:HDOD domain-containing protein [Phycisphaerales bacterium]
MKPRAELSASEIDSVREQLNRRLDGVGIASQPEVAMRLLSLAGDPKAELQDWAKVLRNDPAVSARVMKLANSAFFAQRKPVTNLDRACLVMGLERLKAIALGFHLSRAAGVSGVESIARQVWGQSIFRACLACSAARITAPGLVPEAFITGLMLDAGIPLMARLHGDSYVELFESTPCPATLLRREMELYPFTHVDIIAVLAKRWRFPDLLAKPLDWHHTRPASNAQVDLPQRLHRIAFVAGIVELNISPGKKLDETMLVNPHAITGQKILGISEQELSRLITTARGEYELAIDLFSDMAQSVTDMAKLAESVHLALSSAVDSTIESAFRAEVAAAGDRLTIGQSSIELHRADDGTGVAYLYDSAGKRLLAHRFRTAEETARTLCEALGVERPTPEVLARVQTALRRLAA